MEPLVDAEMLRRPEALVAFGFLADERFRGIG